MIANHCNKKLILISLLSVILLLGNSYFSYAEKHSPNHQVSRHMPKDKHLNDRDVVSKSDQNKLQEEVGRKLLQEAKNIANGKRPQSTLLLEYVADDDCKLSLVSAIQVLKRQLRNKASFSSYINYRDERGRTALMIACLKGHESVAQYLIECQADLDTKNTEGETALMWACIMGHVNIVKILLQHGADMYAKNDHGEMAFTWACCRGSTDIVRLFIEVYKIKLKQPHLIHAFFGACVNGRSETARFLIACGIDINAIHGYDETILTLALENGRMNILRLLIDHKASVHAKNKDGSTTLVRACQINSIRGIYILLLGYLQQKSVEDFKETLRRHTNEEIRKKFIEYAETNITCDVVENKLESVMPTGLMQKGIEKKLGSEESRRHTARIETYSMPLAYHEDIQKLINEIKAW